MKHPPGDPMTLGNMRELGVQRLIASCLNDACRHTALIDVSSYPVETEVPYFRSRVVCGSRGNKIDVRPNWKEQSPATGAWSTRIRRLQAQIAKSAGLLIGGARVLVGEGRVAFRDVTSAYQRMPKTKPDYVAVHC